ncbi:MAG TPA: UDP-N-acetylmuramoyl-L-alanyl-D-glutamate--2,6-diaminopimelate ligase, partial [Firmicutes bacterium]|nr:UDP-N-acetylmuramoyl-L-alanyl-D-glutamate--2,6-diaminopimelate ligase [Bacillota bacterium]
MTNEMQQKPQLLSWLLKGIPVIAHHGTLETEVAGLSADSRATRPGDLFFALPGQHVDGHRFVAEALAQGAAAALVQTPGDWDGNWVVVPDSLEAMAIATANFYEHPAEALQLIAVTGSNGKTTCAFLIEALLQAAGKTPGLLSTIEYRGPGWSEP